MKPILRWLLFPVTLGLLLVIAYSPLPIPAYLDFQALYHANMGVLRGIPLYDLNGQVDMIAELANVTSEQVILLPFVYPPWYALLTLPLAILPIAVAARFWFALNLFMLLLFVWLITDNWPAPRRLISFLLAILFLPVMGALIVGQFTFPILLGAGMLVYALPRERALVTAVGLFLLTFKPHIGGLVFFAVIVYLLLKRDIYARRVLWIIAGILMFFFAVSFIVDQAWPINYFETLFGFRDVSPCKGICISFPMVITSFLGADFSQAVWVAGILLIAWTGWFIGSRPGVLKDAKVLISASLCIALLSSPYQYNYDFVVLLLPFFILTPQAQKRLDWIVLALAYFLPWIGLIFGRQGNSVLLISTFGLMLLLWRQSSALDLHP